MKKSLQGKLGLNLIAMVGVMLAGSASCRADVGPSDIHISWANPHPNGQTGLLRAIGDGNTWTFRIVLDDADVYFSQGPVWSYPGRGGGTPEWGVWGGGADGATWLSWVAPQTGGQFSVGFSGKLKKRHNGGGGGGGDGVDEEKDCGGSWSGQIQFNALLKVQRVGPGTPPSLSSNTSVAAGGKAGAEHTANVVVTITDTNGNPVSGMLVPAPQLTGGKGTASISPPNINTANDGTAVFTFKSSAVLSTFTVNLDIGQLNGAQSASIDQLWGCGALQIPNPYFEYDGEGTDLSLQFLLNGTIPITGHSAQGYVLAESGFVWNDQTGEFQPAITALDTSGLDGSDGTLITQASGPASFVSYFNPAPISDAGTGTYATKLIVPWDTSFIVDEVTVNIEDLSVDSS